MDHHIVIDSRIVRDTIGFVDPRKSSSQYDVAIGRRLEYSVNLPSPVSNVVAARLNWIKFFDAAGARQDVFDRVPYVALSIDPFNRDWSVSPVQSTQRCFAVFERADPAPTTVSLERSGSLARVSRLTVRLTGGGGDADEYLGAVHHALSLTLTSA